MAGSAHDWLSRAGKMGPSCPLRTARVNPAPEKKCVEQNYKVRNIWTISATKSHKAAEDSQNKK